LSGEAQSTPFPQISGRLARSLATTGHPRAIASNGGKPKPSVKEGNARHRQSSSRLASSPSLTRPSQATPDIWPAPWNTRPSASPATASLSPAAASLGARPANMPMFLCGAGLPSTNTVSGPPAAVRGERSGIHVNACSWPLGMTAILSARAMPQRANSAAENLDTVMTDTAAHPSAGINPR